MTSDSDATTSAPSLEASSMALIAAVRAQSIETIKQLLAAGAADPMYVAKEGESAMDIAEDMGNPEIILLLETARRNRTIDHVMAAARRARAQEEETLAAETRAWASSREEDFREQMLMNAERVADLRSETEQLRARLGKAVGGKRDEGREAGAGRDDGG